DVLHGALPPGDAASRPRRDRADLALRGSDRSIRTRPGKGKRERGKVVKQHSIAVLPGDGIGPEVIAQAERALEAAGERFGIEFTLRRFPLGAAGGGGGGGPWPGKKPQAGARG